MNDAIYLIKVSTDDYEALYLDGAHVLDGHRLYLSEVLDLVIGYQLLGYEEYYVKPEVIEDKFNWNFPNNFDEFDSEDLIT